VQISTLSTTAPSLSLKGNVSQSAQTKSSSGFSLWGDDGFSFADILDIINPLQHLPIVSTIYRALTGDAIASAPRVLGDGLFGGPIGAAVGAANAVLKYLSGKDVGEHMLALLPLPTRVEEGNVMLAFNNAPPASSTTQLAGREAATSVLRQQQTLAQVTNQTQLMTALDAYARNSRLVSATQRQGIHGVRF
jgi:hypothetical protein